jgi:tetratricopeptide (TPR) repeat protein
LWGLNLFQRWMRGRGIDKNIDDIGQQHTALHATIQAMAAQIAALQVARAGQPVGVEAEARAAKSIEAAVTDLAQRTDTKSKQAFARLEAGDTGAAKRLFGEVLEEKAKEGATANKEAAEAARNIAAFTRLQNVAEAADLYARAAKLDPTNIENWIDLGDLSVDVGRSADARRAFSAATDRAEEAQDEWWIMVARNRLGDVAVSEGKLAEAVELFEQGKTVSNRLAKADPDNAGWQRDLSVSYDRVGDVLVAQGNLPEALKAFRDSLAIADRLAKADPDNAGWQRDLALSFGRVAQVLARQDNLDEAQSGFGTGRTIVARLQAQSPDNATLPKDLAWFDSQLAQLGRSAAE